MDIFGIANTVKFNVKDLGVFMYDFDGIDLQYVIEECNFLRELFSFDIYALKSSENSCHLISFDIMKMEEISTIQNYVSIESDFINVKDCQANFFNILRLGDKGDKDSPKFVKVFYAQKNNRLKSEGHYKVYHEICGVPEMPKILQKNLIKTEINRLIYKSHKEVKIMQTKWIK
jgi:hypothetical protein